MLINTFSGKVVRGPNDIGGYWQDRMNHDLYRLMLSMTRSLFPNAQSAIDVGCYTSALIVEMDWIKTRVATDLQTSLSDNWREVDGVDFLGGDAFNLDFDKPFDLVISNQTIEHLEDPPGFVKKLLSIGNGLIISTTYETPAGLIDGHIQDPIDMQKFKSWFPVDIDSYTICYHPSRNIKHIIAVIRESHPATSRYNRPQKLLVDSSTRCNQVSKSYSYDSDSNIDNPKPKKTDVLRRLKQITQISAVVDVGVRECTSELISEYPDVKHYLFEPVSTFFSDIKTNYRSINYELFPVALSNENSLLYLEQRSLNHNGIVTHSAISSEKSLVDGSYVILCDPIQVFRYEDMDISNVIPNNFLLKVDVDGKDLEVVKGFGDKINNASIIIIEATYTTLLDRLAYIHSKGFQLVDIVDIVYYGYGVYQFDLVFVRSDLINSTLRPSLIKFEEKLWSPLNI